MDSEFNHPYHNPPAPPGVEAKKTQVLSIKKGFLLNGVDLHALIDSGPLLRGIALGLDMKEDFSYYYTSTEEEEEPEQLEPQKPPVAGPSHSAEETSIQMSAMPGPSGCQDNLTPVSTDSQPQEPEQLEPQKPPVAGPSHSADTTSIKMSAMPEPSGCQDNSTPVSTGSQPQDIETEQLEPQKPPVAGPSHSSDENFSQMSAMPGPSGCQDNSTPVSTDSQPQGSNDEKRKKDNLSNSPSKVRSQRRKKKAKKK